MVFAVIIWTLVGLFWATVVFFHFWNKDEKRHAAAKQFGATAATKVYKAVEKPSLKMYDAGLTVANWIRARFHLAPKLTRGQRERERVVSFLAHYGIRSAWWVDATGEPQLAIHQDDTLKLPAALDQMRADAESGRPVPVS